MLHFIATGKFKALIYLKRILRAGKPTSWGKPNKIRKSLDLQPPPEGSRGHTYLSSSNEYMNVIRISTCRKKEVHGFRKENSVWPTLSTGILLSPNSIQVEDKNDRFNGIIDVTPPEKSGMCKQNENVREMAIKYEWLQGLRSKFVAAWRKKCFCKKPKCCNSPPSVRTTSKNYMSQMHDSSMEVSSKTTL